MDCISLVVGKMISNKRVCMIFFIVTPFADAHGRGDGFGGFLKLRVSKMWWSGGEHTRASIFLLSPITQKRGVRSQKKKRNALFQRIIAPARVSLLPCCDVEKKMTGRCAPLLLNFFLGDWIFSTNAK